MAFFPCIYFESAQMLYYTFDSGNLKNLTTSQKYDCVIERVEKRNRFYLILWKLFAVVEKRGLRMIVENPATEPHFLLYQQNFFKPTLIDKNRQVRGDYFRKPTAYWFVNIKPTYGESFQKPKETRVVTKCKKGAVGFCNEERSLMSPDYARNFICDFILGRTQSFSIPTLF